MAQAPSEEPLRRKTDISGTLEGMTSSQLREMIRVLVRGPTSLTHHPEYHPLILQTPLGRSCLAMYSPCDNAYWLYLPEIGIAHAQQRLVELGETPPPYKYKYLFRDVEILSVAQLPGSLEKIL